MSTIEKRLYASLAMDVVNGDDFERSVFAGQVREAASHIGTLEHEMRLLRRDLDESQAISDGLLTALQELIDDLAMRARLRGDVDPDGVVVLDASRGKVEVAHAAIAKATGAADG